MSDGIPVDCAPCVGVSLETGLVRGWPPGEELGLEDVEPGGVFLTAEGDWYARGLLCAREATGRTFWQCLGLRGQRAGWLCMLDGARRVRVLGR